MCIDHQIWMVYDGLLILLIVLLHFTHILWWLRDISELSMQVGMEHTWRFGICLEATQQHTATYSNRSKFSLPPRAHDWMSIRFHADNRTVWNDGDIICMRHPNKFWLIFSVVPKNIKELGPKIVVLKVIMISQLTARVFSMLLGWFQSIAAACSQV